MTRVITSADGVKGCLLYIHGVNTYVFRVYKDDSFKDYDLRHCDLGIVIQDKDAYFYDDGHRLILDHSPATLGIVSNGNEP